MFERLRKALSQPKHPGGHSSWFRLFEPTSEREMRERVGDGLGSSVIVAPVAWIARAWPAAPLTVVETDGDETNTVRDHEMIGLVSKPNDFYSGTVLWWTTLVSFLITGNAYWLKVRDQDGRGMPRELWWTPPWTIEPKWSRDGSDYVSHYEYKPTGAERIILEPSDVVHFRYGLDPKNVRLGLSPISSVLSEVFTDDEAARYSASILRNMGIPGLFVSPKGEQTPSADEVAALRSKLDTYSGENRGKSLVFGAPTEVKAISFTASDLDLSGLRDISEERVCAVLGVPAAIVGFGAGLQQTKVGATMRELRASAWEDCIIPMQRLIAEQLVGQLLVDFEGENPRRSLEFDTSKIKALADDETQRVERLTRSLTSGALLVADYQRMLGLPVDEAQRVYLRPVSLFEVPEGQAGMPVPEPAGAPETRGMNGHAKAMEKRATRAQARLVARFERESRTLARGFSRKLDEVFTELGEAIGRAADDVLKARTNGVERKVEIEDLDDDDFRTATAIAEGVSWARIKDTFRRAYESHYLTVFEATVNGISDVLSLSIDLPDPVARHILETGGRRAGLVDLREQTLDRLFRELTEARELGENPLSIARRVREMVPAGPWSSPKVRAEVIARTETLHAQRSSQLAAYRAADSVTQVMIFDDRLGYGDADCVARAGRIVSFTEAERMAEDEHPNGTLSFAPVVE